MESLASLEKAVPSPKDEEEPVDGGMNIIISEIHKQSIMFLSRIVRIDKQIGVNRSRNTTSQIFALSQLPNLFLGSLVLPDG